FLGRDGHQRLNCAESILTAFGELDQVDKEKISRGHGRAPQGECGAICAAKAILAKTNLDHVKEMEDEFIKVAGSTKCREIRKLRKISCLGCVEKSAELLHKRINK
ncbi:MAG: C-GCAxxG-C-C family protein, partial [Candidatus Margulisbacteria bacterium]|nr:C-GCAxxG-C-C family protein [Candidatus Margulisiibacteriota bacterium]